MMPREMYAGKAYTLVGRFSIPDTDPQQFVEIDSGGKLEIKASNGNIETIDISEEHKKVVGGRVEYHINHIFPKGCNWLLIDWQVAYNGLPVGEFRMVRNILFRN